MEMTMKMSAFEALDNEEMLAVDGGDAVMGAMQAIYQGLNWLSKQCTGKSIWDHAAASARTRGVNYYNGYRVIG